MANNHTLDRGEQAIMNATDYLRKIDMRYVGSYRNEEDRNTPRILTKKIFQSAFFLIRMERMAFRSQREKTI